MSGYRITGAIAAVAFALLLGWVVVLSFGGESMVTPTVAVTTPSPGSEPNTAPSANEILAARTRLMDDRSSSGAGAFPPLAAGGRTLGTSPNVADPDKTVRGWLNQRPDAEMLRDSGNVSGLSSLPYRNAQMLEQPGGRTWRRAHNDQVRYGGGWAIFGILLALSLFLFARGRVPIAEGFSGQTIERFKAVERANHWMTATAFVIMALTGLIIMYGKPLLIPLIGEPALGTLAWWSVWLHMASAVPFVLGILVMIALWLKDNLPTRLDWEWLKQGGGFLRDKGPFPPARKFNAGQKVVFWGVVTGGLALLATGIVLMFPFYWFGYDGMQTAQTSHAVIALLMVMLIFGHVYIGTIGMQGAFDAMWSGQVDRNWAKEHHSIWYERLTGRRAEERERPPQGTPAE